MPDRFVITGSGRSGTKYFSRLLTKAGVLCGHEHVFSPDTPTGTGSLPWGDLQADSSWMAAPHLPLAGVPVVLVVRHPLAVVRSWVELAFFSDHPAQRNNPCHDVLRAFAPAVYEYDSEADRALAMWLVLNRNALEHAELLYRFETLTAGQVARLIRWAGHPDGLAEAAYASTGVVNRHDVLRARVGSRTHPAVWDDHNKRLADQAQDLAEDLGYDPNTIPATVREVSAA